MLRTDVLLTIPTEAVAIRAIVASIVALLLVRLVLHVTRLPRHRVAAVLVPTGALLVVVAASWGATDLPMSLMVAGEAANALALPFHNEYVEFVPVGLPAVIGVWAVIATAFLARRCRRVLRTSRQARELFTLRSAPPPRLTATAERVAARLRVAVPPVAIGDDVCGGASVVGIRRPLLLIDRTLFECLDDEELEGLVAHELAHIRRRDNLLAFVVGCCRDLTFFVPGGRWVVRHLHHEREAAADALAVEATSRPGALASGLLKAIESRQVPTGASALAPGGTLEQRVMRLCEDQPAVGRGRAVAEGAAVAGALAASVSLALGVPAWVAASGGETPLAGVAVMWSNSDTSRGAPAPIAEPAAFSAFRNTGFVASEDAPIEKVSLVDDGRELNPAVLRQDPIDGLAPAARVGWTPVEPRSLGLTPTPRARVDARLLERWRATSVLQTDEGLGLGVYLLSRDVPRP